MSELYVSLVAFVAAIVSGICAAVFLKLHKEAFEQVQSIRRIQVLSNERDKVELALTRAELAMAETHRFFLISYGCGVLTSVLIAALAVAR